VCALLQSGAVRCDGFDNPGAGVPSDAGLARISLGGNGLCGLTRAGEAQCYGSAYVARITPPPGPYLETASNRFNACGLRGDGAVECWGDDLGNGAGTETCPLAVARLSRNGGEPMIFDAGEHAWGRNIVTGATGWSYATDLRRPQATDRIASAFAHIAGSLGRLSDARASPRATFADGEPVELAASLWALDAVPDALGEVWCSAPGSGSTLLRHGDELRFDLRELASLGSCPGAPVNGQLAWCGAQSCPEPNLRGSLAGTAWAEIDSGYAIGGGAGEIELADGSYLKFTQDTLTSELGWGLLVTSLQGPFGGQVFCIGEAIGSGTNWTFQSLSTLGACPSGSAGTLTGCVR
jgi:hypothetical protein